MTGDSASGTRSVLLLLLGNPENPQCWNAFLERYATQIYSWCRQRGLQEADAQDVTQDVLTKLVQKLKTFAYDPDKGSFRGWLKTLTHHAWCDYLRSRHRAGVAGEDPKILEMLKAREDLLASLAETFDLELLAEAQARVQLRVTPRDWRIFEALALEGCPVPLVAKELGMNVTAVRMAKSRVQKKLRLEIGCLEQSDSHSPEG